MARLIALLRAVNVGGRKLPMAELRGLCADLGWGDVETYIQSGNVVFSAPAGPEPLEAELEAALRNRFAFEVPVMVRDVGQWSAYEAANPFPEAARDEPNRLLLFVTKRPLAPDAAGKLMERAQGGEFVKSAGGALWFHFPEGVGASRITPAWIDKACGSPATGRNWRTVLKLGEMVR